ncbi:MAG: hypothetical protein AB3N63_16425 [Puniceicoccaceae bacterium]
MTTHEIKLTGWKAIVVLVAIIGLVGYRFISQKDLTDDVDLMRKIEMELQTLYVPDQVDQMKAAQEAGDMKKLEELAKAVTTTKLTVLSVKASQPMFDFSSPRDVVLKVTYTLEDASTAPVEHTNFYLFEHSYVTGNWRYRYESSSIGYYLNFL